MSDDNAHASYANQLTKFLDEPETLRGFLNRRKRELTAQIAALRGQIAPKEQELKEVEIAIEALPPAPVGVAPAPSSLPVAQGVAVAPMTFGLAEVGRSVASTRFQQMTIKQLVVQALLDAFPQGASTSQIRNFIKDAYGREIEPSSLRPQMHRLKNDGRLLSVTPGSGDQWNLEPKARQLYSRYDHPTSRSAMTELQDDPE